MIVLIILQAALPGINDNNVLKYKQLPETRKFSQICLGEINAETNSKCVFGRI